MRRPSLQTKNWSGKHMLRSYGGEGIGIVGPANFAECASLSEMDAVTTRIAKATLKSSARLEGQDE